MTFSMSSIFYRYQFKRYYSELEGLENNPGAYVISKCEYDANSSKEICTVIGRGWTESLKNDIDKIGSFVKKLKAWGGLQSNDMNIDWTPKRQSKKPFNNRQLKKK